MTPQHTPTNPITSFRTRFAHRFLRALKDLNRHGSSAPSSTGEIYGRFRRVKVAADASMASAVGSRRVWSRAMLRRIRNQSRHHRGFMTRGILRRRRRRGNPRKNSGFGQTSDLRKLVPGGETMNICSLLDETADYIKCLTTQVQVMRNLVNFYSTT